MQLLHRSLLGLLLAGHSLWIFSAFGSTYSGPDAPGYFLQARLLATQGTSGLRPESAAQFIDHHMLDTGAEVFQSRYPPGLPLLLALAYRIGGPQAALAVNPILATASVFLVYLLGRQWIGRWPALLAACLYATLPTINEQALLGFAHLAVAAFLLCGILLLEKWKIQPHPTLGLVTGGILGFLPTIRYPAATLGLGICIYLLLSIRDSKRRLIASAGFIVLGAVVPAALLLLHNTFAYGSPLRTGYALTAEQQAFSLTYLHRSGLEYMKTLLTDAGALTAAGLCGMVAMLGRREWRNRGLLLVAMLIPFTLTYMAYYSTVADARFLVPTMPFYALSSCCLIAFTRNKRLQLGIAAGIVCLHLAVAIPGNASRIERMRQDLARADAVLFGVQKLIPKGSVVIAPASVQLLLNFYGDWRLAEKSLVSLAPPSETGPVFPKPYTNDGGRQPSTIQPGHAAGLRSKYLRLEPGPRTARVMSDLAAWAGDEDIYWIGSAKTVEGVTPYIAQLGKLRKIGVIELPAFTTNPKGYSSPGRSGRPMFWIPQPPLDVFRLE